MVTLFLLALPRSASLLLPLLLFRLCRLGKLVKWLAGAGAAA
jgi:hypothetical protein